MVDEIGAGGSHELAVGGGLWGKWPLPGSGNAAPYPLIAHLLDTAAIAAAMWKEWVSDPLKQRLASSFQAPVSAVGAHFAWLAGSHDIGKADPVFQGQLFARDQQDPQFRDHLAGTGLPLPSDEWLRNIGAVLDKARPHLRHEALTADILQRTGAHAATSSILSGHHGRYPCYPESGPYSRVTQHRSFLAASQWHSQHEQLIATVSAAVGTSTTSTTSTLSCLSGELIPLMTGLVVLADWLASDEAFIADSPLEALGDPAGYYKLRCDLAREHLRANLGYAVSRAGSFQELFGFEPTRPIQQWAVSELEPSGLTVIAVPMGEGKTETALWLHSVPANSCEGLIFALPTTATTDAMFDRIRKFYADTAGFAHLAHGQAILNSFYTSSNNRAVSVCDSESGLTASEWFNGRHRSLVAPVTASTCDQVLAVGVSHKFIAVRLASLANKHVILDEVHTYDPYQDRLLERTLTWLGAFGTRVTLLSATLPTRRVNAYLRAYANGMGTASSDIALAGVYPAVTTLARAGVPRQQHVEASRRYEHSIQVKSVPVADADAHTARLFTELAAKVGRTGLIVNMVDRAISIAKQLIETFPNLVLLHSRMTAIQREKATQALLTRCGKNAAPGWTQVVATQIAEASLDIDMDVLLTDLAPMTSLLQRMGRQWRHSQPPGDGTWVHRPGFDYRTGNPVVHVLCQMGADGDPSPSARFPYTQAEMLKTWRKAETLDGGRRTSMHIPDDVQRAVDCADVSFDDLLISDNPDDLADLPEGVLLDHLANQVRAQAQADVVGVSAPELRDGWERDPHWEECDALARLTQGDLWRADATTRLRDSFSIELLACDHTKLNPHAWHGQPASLLSICSRKDELAVLRHVIPVTGALAKELKERSVIGEQDEWKHHPATLLRSLTPIDLNDVLDLCILTDFGLEKIPKRASV